MLTFSAVSIGMAKPMPAALARMAVLTPMTSPNSLSSGPACGDAAGSAAWDGSHGSHGSHGCGDAAGPCAATSARPHCRSLPLGSGRLSGSSRVRCAASSRGSWAQGDQGSARWQHQDGASSTLGAPPELPGLMAASVWMKLTFLLGMPTWLGLGLGSGLGFGQG